MNVKKAIKKIVALGSGLTMIGATIMGATALDLGDYPAPFVQNGVYSGKIVVGAAAATADVLGAIDISASLQAEAKSGVSVGGAVATTTVSGGVQIEDETNQDYNWGDSISTTALDNGDFPVLMADKTLETGDGTTYDYEQELAIGNKTLDFDRSVDNDIYDSPVLYLDLDVNTEYIFTYTIDFDSGDEVDWPALEDSEEIELFGTVWTIKDIATGDDIILYGSDVSQLVSLNSPVDVEIDGESHTLNLVGANADAAGGAEVHVSVDGTVKSMQEGDTKTVNGVQVFVQDVFVSNVGGESASAILFIGSKEMNLGPADGTNSTTQVEVDDEDLDGVEVKFTGTGDTAIEQIDFYIDSTEVLNEDTDEDYDWLALGDTFKDPLFGFELSFAEAIPDFMASSRDYVQFRSSNDDLEVTFTNHDGDEYTFSPYMWNQTTGGVNITAGEDFLFAGQNLLADDAIFILEEDASSSEPVSKVYQFTGTSDSDTKADFKDLSGGSFSVGDGDTIGDSTVSVTIDSEDVINLSAATLTRVYTVSGAQITFATPSNQATETVTIVEDEQGVNTDEIAGGTFTVAIAYDTTDEEITIGSPGAWDGTNDDDDTGDLDIGIDEYGTYYVQEADESTELELWFPPEDVDYAVYVLGSGAVVSTTSGSDDSTAYNVNPIGVGIGVLDTAAPALGSTPMIVVGGPCANTVAAELMGNPANCVEGFEEGKAVIKYYADDNAILVAGFSATDTQGASRVLADYADWDLSGSEVEVVVPSLSSISVNPVA
ncbi:hypothetical protein ACFLTH_16885 [Bacteroidota bacterium]